MEEYSQWVEGNHFCKTNNTINKLNGCFFSSYDQRVATFFNWPDALPSKVTMSSAGFYFTKLGDKVTCFHCNESLSGWSPYDDPYVEHAFWYPQCLYIRTLMGEISMKKIEKFPRIGDGNSRSKLFTSVNTCKSCFKNEVNVSFFPCSHTRYCEECVRRNEIIKCPSCDENIQLVIDVKL